MRTKLGAQGLALVLCGSLSHAQALTYLFGPGEDSGDRLGWSAADVPDLDGDGHPDLLVGAAYADQNGQNSGAVYAYSGRTGALLRTWVGEAANDCFGWSVDGLTDVDGDGSGDLIVGAPFHDLSGGLLNAGKVYVYSGQSGALLAAFEYTQYGARFGMAVCGLGDIDADGVGDYAFGTPYFDDEVALHTDAGRIDVYSGAGTVWLGVAVGTSANDLFGYDLELFDVGATLTETRLIVGAPGAAGKGAAMLVTATGTKFTAVFGNTPNGWFGASVAAVGDVAGGGGLPDVAVGEPYADGPSADAGRVTVFTNYSGGGLGLFSVIGNSIGGERFGWSVAGVGDYDGDGFNDILIGAPLSDAGGSSSGKVVVFSVATGTKVGVWSGQPGDQLGHAVSSAGDLNLDGTPDLLLGAPFSTSQAGLAEVLLARAPLPSTYCNAKTNSLGCVPTIGYGGVPSLSIADDFHIEALDVLNKKNGLMFWGHASASIPFYDATLCVQPPLKRTAVMHSGGSASGNDCTGQYVFQFSHAYMQSEAVAAGDTLYAQFWSRDPLFTSPFDFSLTDALSFDIVP